jgi:hypothetical protein
LNAAASDKHSVFIDEAMSISASENGVNLKTLGIPHRVVANQDNRGVCCRWIGFHEALGVFEIVREQRNSFGAAVTFDRKLTIFVWQLQKRET